MALGNLLYEEKGKQLSARTVDLVEPTAEISGMGTDEIPRCKYQYALDNIS